MSANEAEVKKGAWHELAAAATSHGAQGTAVTAQCLAEAALGWARAKGWRESKAEFGDPRLSERFWSKVVVASDGCWIWAASIKPAGYGQFRLNGRTAYPHRVAFEALVGPIPSGLFIDHLCRNRACCNPTDLEPVTHCENVRRGRAMGHTWNRGNTWSRGEKSGMAKLSADQVIEIRRRYRSGEAWQRELAEEFGVQASNISAIVTRKSWAHLDAIEAELEGRP